MLRPIQSADLKALYQEHIRLDFPKNERPPYIVLKHELEKKTFYGLFFNDQGADAGYAINATGHDNNFVLIYLFAIYNEQRGKGAGTRFMQEIIENYAHKKAIILEVERPQDADSEREKKLRGRRIIFYERIGFKLYNDIDYSLFGVPLFLMVYDLQCDEILTSQAIAEAVQQIYRKLLGRLFNKKLQIKYMDIVNESE